jgi:hypothetical protein
MTNIHFDKQVTQIMTNEYELQRYAAYFRGWCQAFGEHDSLPNEDTGICWLLSEHQVGFLLRPQLTKALFREVLMRNDKPVLELSQKGARIGTFHYPLSGEIDEQGFAAIRKILENHSDTCLFLTSHFLYGTGTRIFTLSSKKPLSIIYKEIGCMHIRLD